ncbi:MAG: hypothetical protein M0R66_04295 [Candidatus Omnitrophica bacterium]|jgi:hypothetical protein|nr:hypothetical protein [Candidatus Omnitrophota bacterium]
MRTAAEIQVELDALNALILEIIQQKFAFVSMSGRTVTYHDLPKLREHRTELEAELARAAGSETRTFVQYGRP